MQKYNYYIADIQVANFVIRRADVVTQARKQTQFQEKKEVRKFSWM